jgi:hypothetical protein
VQTGSPSPARISWWLAALLAIALLFMLFGLWTAAARLRASGWPKKLLRRPSQPASAIEYGGLEQAVVVRTANGYAILVEVFVVDYLEDQSRVEAFCAQLAGDKYKFRFAPPGFEVGGPRWQQHFLDALEHCDVVLVVLTEMSLGQKWMNWQIQKAKDLQRNRDVPIHVAALDQRVFDVAHTVALLEGIKWYQATPEGRTELKSLLLDAGSSRTRDLRCFISYSHLHRDFATKLCADLNDAKVHTWMDVDGIPGGAAWKQKIAEAILASTHVLFLLTAESAKSDQVMAEIDWAEAHHKTVIPIMEEDIELPFGLVGTQAIGFAPGYDAGFRKLLQGLTASQTVPK